MWCEFIWLMLGKVTGFCECSNEPLRPIKGREFIQQATPISFSKMTLLHRLGQFIISQQTIHGSTYTDTATSTMSAIQHLKEGRKEGRKKERKEERKKERKKARRKCTNIHQIHHYTNFIILKKMFLNLKVCQNQCHPFSSREICTLEN